MPFTLSFIFLKWLISTFLSLLYVSPPFVEKDVEQTGITADLTVYCIESATTVILTQLQSSLANQGNRRIFGNDILQVQYPGEN